MSKKPATGPILVSLPGRVTYVGTVHVQNGTLWTWDSWDEEQVTLETPSGMPALVTDNTTGIREGMKGRAYYRWSSWFYWKGLEWNRRWELVTFEQLP